MNWYLQDIERLEAKEIIKTRKKKVVFYGSSSFTRWDAMEKTFHDFAAVNLGFGGSTLAACTWFFERVVPKHKPHAIVIYAGDNDLGDGRTSEEVIIFFKQIVCQIRESLGEIPIGFVSIKPSPARMNLKPGIEYANKIISEIIAASPDNLFYIDIYSKMLNEKGGPRGDLYVHDNLHLSAKGYEIWEAEINEALKKVFHRAE